ncbi:response regulator transcription factor [Nonlabens ponticola]|uniref:Phosphate regulon transcriptional regulatory protein PhoB n=1 Tax=Nonlabens ponticola TaxID=2496866 RepID=A0A3S9MVX9_9FLAO|nr:response regulator transcription factor [Nonlabens ponticola]AZQ43340.1 response regulator transcription factor [Nonlabens ponticola]
MKTLIIEDDKELSDLLALHVDDLDTEIIQRYDGQSGLEAALENDVDLILLDITMPKLDGIEVCKRIRKEKNTPIIMVTSRSEEIDKVLGLEIGADDYITKPFSIRELKARIKAVLRRTESVKSTEQKDSQDVLQFTDLGIDIPMRKVMVRGERIELSPKEFELLVVLASNQGRSFSRGELLNMIWGYNFSGYEHTVNSHINRLRIKVEKDMSAPEYILTTWGIGYRFNEEI